MKKALFFASFFLIGNLLANHVEKGWDQMESYHDKVMFVVERETALAGENQAEFQRIYNLVSNVENNSGAKKARERCKQELQKKGLWDFVTKKVADQIKKAKIPVGIRKVALPAAKAKRPGS